MHRRHTGADGVPLFRVLGHRGMSWVRVRVGHEYFCVLVPSISCDSWSVSFPGLPELYTGIEEYRWLVSKLLGIYICMVHPDLENRVAAST